jgi:hypothetical protein
MQLLAVLLGHLSAVLGSTTQHYLTATAIISDLNGDARIQCWQFETAFETYPTVGMAMHLGQVSNLSYVVLPPRAKEGLHKPPHPMYVFTYSIFSCLALLTHLCRLFVLLSGLAHVTLIDGSDEVWILEGLNGFIVAVDTVGMGHFTDYPSDKETVALQIPFADGVVPDHKVLMNSACHSPSQVVDRNEELGAISNELKRSSLNRK